MKTLHITVSDKKAKYRERDGEIVCGNNDYQIEFAFDAEWNAYYTKTARFITGETYTDVVFEGNICAVPIIKGVTSFSVGVFAGNLFTTTPAVIGAHKSILCDNGSPEAPSDDVYAQIMLMLNNDSDGPSMDQIVSAVIAALPKATVYNGKVVIS